MKTTPVEQHGIQLTRLGFVNCYLVREADGFTLIDTGLKNSEQEILAAADAAGAPIRRILLTHAHVDHVGSVDALVGAIPGVGLYASERSLPLLRQPPDTTLRAGEAPGKIEGGLSGIRTAVTDLIEEGRLCGSLRAISTPGHIPGHLAFLDERDGTLYAGDALICIGRLSVNGWAPWYFPFRVTQSKPTALASARRLLEFPIQRFACGHGQVRQGGLAALKAAVANANLRIQN
jgi:glyoxylase-like metal-dependent hydrolase (beta-lactamase superfamily II)